MTVNTEVLTLILGGGQGTRLFPLTQQRSKPAVPIGGKYRLIDIPISNCLHADIRRIFVLTQFNSASLNRHIAQSYRMDLFSQGFVEILAAEQRPDDTSWYQGTADAVRKAARHFTRHDADYYLILAGDHLYRMDYGDLIDAHVDRGADITIAAQPVSIDDASSMGVFGADQSGHIVTFEEKPSRERLDAMGRGPFMASMGIYVFSRDVLLETIEQDGATDFGRQIIPHALAQYHVQSYPFRGYWADVGTVTAFYDANIMLTRPDAPFRFYDPKRPIYTHPRFLPGARISDCTVRDCIINEGCNIEQSSLEQSIVGIRTNIERGARITRSALLGADYYEAEEDATLPRGVPRLGIGRDVILDRVIVDKNARIGDGVRLTNERGVDRADGDGYHIRNGIIVVAKDGVIQAGTRV